MTEVIVRLAAARRALREAENALYEVTNILTNSGQQGEILHAMAGCYDSAKRSREWLDMQTLDNLTTLISIKGESDAAER